MVVNALLLSYVIILSVINIFIPIAAAAFIIVISAFSRRRLDDRRPAVPVGGERAHPGDQEPLPAAIHARTLRARLLQQQNQHR